MDRFWGKVKRSDGCWEWTAAFYPNGYGAFWNGKGMRPSHRISWQMAFGEIPNGMWVCHRCDNRKCVNPSHLFLGTPLDNVRDMMSKGRQNFIAPPRRKPKLTIEQVNQIRESKENSFFLSKVFGVSPGHIRTIRCNRCWK